MAIQRVIATERLKVNPGDIEAINILATVQQKVSLIRTYVGCDPSVGGV